MVAEKSADMRIAVFGDSFAVGQSDRRSWMHHLAQRGHDIDNLAESGSSIMFSVQKIRQHVDNHDFGIWCMTSPGRMSVEIAQDGMRRFVHFSATTRFEDVPYVSRYLYGLHKSYYLEIADHEQENLIGQALAHYMLSQHPNLMIIPCFEFPLQQRFSLNKVSESELQHFFPDKQSRQVYELYTDRRVCHLCDRNNEILADLIGKDLSPGIWQASITDFVLPSSIEDILQRNDTVRKW